MITQETEPAKVGNSKFHWWQALREYADDAKTIGFKKRVALFLVLFCIPLTAYVMSFLNGTETGIRMDEISSSSMSAIVGWLFSGSSGTMQRIGDGIARVVSLPCVDVIAMSMISAFVAVTVIAIAVKIWRVAVLLWETSNHVESMRN